MRRQERIAGGLAITVVMAMVAVGCGGGGSSSSEDSTSSSNSGETTASSTTSESSNADPSEFVGKGENGQLVRAGKEADDPEREAASTVVEESLQARAAGDWKTQCETLVAPVIKQIEETASVLGAGAGCERALEAQAEPAPASALANTMTGPVDVLRVVGTEQGFAFYHGTQGRDFVVPLLKEGGEWKIASLQEEEIR